MPLTLRLHPRTERAVQRAAAHRSATVCGLVAHIDEHGGVVIDLPDDQLVSELIRQVEAPSQRRGREVDDDGREGSSVRMGL